MDNKKIPKFNLGDEFYINRVIPVFNEPLRMIVFDGNYRVTKIDNEPHEEDILEKSEKK
jgi:hypothetical protein